MLPAYIYISVEQLVFHLESLRLQLAAECPLPFGIFFVLATKTLKVKIQD